MGAIRVEAYISRKVAQIEKLASASGAAGKPGGESPAAVENKTGITVTWYVSSGSKVLEPREAHVAQLAERADSIRAIAAALPAELHAPIAAGDTLVAYVWTLDASSAGTAPDQVIVERRPAFIVQFKDVPGVSPDELTPALVRLAASPQGRRVVVMARGRADEISRTAPEWDVIRDLRQDAVRADAKVIERGTARIQPLEDLPPGDYAVVIRPPRKKLAGATVLSVNGEGRLFATAWTFTIK
jgi:hypothetical protein